MDPVYFGVFGGTLFIIAWVYELYEEIHKHKMYQDLKFAYMNLIGIIAMIIYAYTINSTLFFYLNIVLLFFVGFEIAYSKHLQRKHRKKSKRV